MSAETYERLHRLSELAKAGELALPAAALLEKVPPHCQDPASVSAIVEAVVTNLADKAGIPEHPPITHNRKLYRARKGVGGVHSW